MDLFNKQLSWVSEKTVDGVTYIAYRDKKTRKEVIVVDGKKMKMKKELKDTWEDLNTK